MGFVRWLMVRCTESGVNKLPKVQLAPLQRMRLCAATHAGSIGLVLKQTNNYVTSPDKLFVPTKSIEFPSITLASMPIFVTSTPPKPLGKGPDAPEGGSRARIASDCEAFFQLQRI